MTLCVRQQVDLRHYTTMALTGKARYLVEIEAEVQIAEAIGFAKNGKIPLCVLGGGSNVVFAGDYNGLVMVMNTRGIHELESAGDHVRIEVAAGENWDDFLQYCLRHNWYGLENLAIIPGTVGAAPIQNIGAYGQEVASCIEAVNILHVDTLQPETLSRDECRFGYRDSIFKRELANKCVITSVVFCLGKTFVPELSYKALADAVKAEVPLTAGQMRQAVIAIRQSKLPSPSQLANCGSFFKNPVVSMKQAAALKDQYPEMPVYPQDNGEAKLAAGWLIEKAGWKGRRLGKVGVYPRQALVLANYADASYDDLLILVECIRHDVARQFHILLEQEPVLIAAGLCG